MTMMGLFPWATSGIAIMWVMIFLNGWFQGMGWPPCGRTMVHWWSKSERGTIVSIWNTAHNIGGMMPGAMVLLASAVFFSTHGVEAQAKRYLATIPLLSGYCCNDLCNSSLLRDA